MMAKKINAGLLAAIAVLEEMRLLFEPLTEAEKIDAMEHLVDDLSSQIRCAEDPGMAEVKDPRPPRSV